MNSKKIISYLVLMLAYCMPNAQSQAADLEPLCSIDLSTKAHAATESNFLQIDGQYLYLRYRVVPPNSPISDFTRIFDISNPTSPTTCGYAPVKYDFHVQNGRLLANTQMGMEYHDMSNPGAPRLLVKLPSRSSIFKLSGHHAFLLVMSGNHNDQHLEIWDLMNPQTPHMTGKEPNGPWNIMAVMGKTVFLGNTGGRNTSGFLEIFDVLDPACPKKLSTINELSMGDLETVGPLLFTKAPRFGNITIFNVKNPGKPEKIGHILSSTADRGYNFTVSGSILYAVSPPVGIEIWDISNPKAPKCLDVLKDMPGIQSIAAHDDLIAVFQSRPKTVELHLFRSRYPRKKMALENSAQESDR